MKKSRPVLMETITRGVIDRSPIEHIAYKIMIGLWIALVSFIVICITFELSPMIYFYGLMSFMAVLLTFTIIQGGCFRQLEYKYYKKNPKKYFDIIHDDGFYYIVIISKRNYHRVWERKSFGTYKLFKEPEHINNLKIKLEEFKNG